MTYAAPIDDMTFVLHEIAGQSKVGIALDETRIPVHDSVRDAAGVFHDSF